MYKKQMHASVSLGVTLALSNFRGGTGDFANKLARIHFIHHFRKGFPASAMEFSIICDCGKAKHENDVHAWIHHEHKVIAFPRMHRRDFFLDTDLFNPPVGGIVGGNTGLFNSVGGIRLLFHDDMEVPGRRAVDLGESVQGLALDSLLGGILTVIDGTCLEYGVGGIRLFARSLNDHNSLSCRRILYHHGVILGRLDHKVMVTIVGAALEDGKGVVRCKEVLLEDETRRRDARSKDVERIHNIDAFFNNDLNLFHDIHNGGPALLMLVHPWLLLELKDVVGGSALRLGIANLGGCNVHGWL